MNSKMTVNEEGVKIMMNAMTFLMFVVKKYCLLPYHAELYNLVIDLNNAGVYNFPKNAVMKIVELHQ